jgi:hypothetical protein
MANDREQFDVSSFLNKFDEEYSSNEPVQDTAVPESQDTQDIAAPPTAEPTDIPEKVEPPVEEVPAEPVVEPKEEVTADTVNDPDMHKRNEAFKKLREEKEKLEQSDRFLDELAIQYGLTKTELMAKFKEDKMKKEAEKSGLPLDQFKRMQELETEVATIKQKYQTEAFNFEAERLVQRYNIPANEVTKIFEQIGALGLDVLANPKLLEVAYKALNYESALERGRQTQLQETVKRRQTTASPSLGTKGTNVDTSETDMDSEIDAFLKQKIGK